MPDSEIKFRHFPSVESTNALGNKLLKTENPETWTILSTDTQTHGRGQVGTTWQDESGKNVLMTWVSPPISWPVKRLFDLNMATASALRQALFAYCPVDLKWPNDLLIGGRKVGGILIEPTIRGTYVQRVVIGLGLNVFPSDWPESFQATSLSSHSDHAFDLQKLRDELAIAVIDELEKLLHTGYSPESTYLAACPAYTVKRVYCDVQTNEDFEATMTGVDEHGRLILLDSVGRERIYDLKGVKLYPR